MLFVLRKYFTLFAVIVCSLSLYAQVKKTEVIVCSSIHGAHAKNPNYGYESLFGFIEASNPDIIGVEIRSVDIDSSSSYLKNSYPFEMYEIKNRFKGKKVYGFDWLGDDIKGKSIPKNYWTEISPTKKLQRKLNADSLTLKKLEPLGVISKEKNNLVMSASLTELNDGRYDLLNSVYYQQLELLLKETEYRDLSAFYSRRDEEIAANIIKIITENPGKKLVFILGADHRSYSVSRIRKHFGDKIILAN